MLLKAIKYKQEEPSYPELRNDGTLNCKYEPQLVCLTAYDELKTLVIFNCLVFLIVR